MRLGLNIDHIATLREARKTTEPNLVKAAQLAEKLGVDQITVHLRSDRRHIQDADLYELKSNINIPFNVEISISEEMREIVGQVKPSKVTLVPERQDEITTEGGLDVVNQKPQIELFSSFLDRVSPHTTVAIFVDPCIKQIRACHELRIDEVEINTGQYAEAIDRSEVILEIERILDAAKCAAEFGIEVAAGHGLKESNMPAIIEIKEIQELNIGHHIIADSVFLGLEEKVKRILKLIKQPR